MFLFYCSFPVPLQWPAQRPFIENIIFCWIKRSILGILGFSPPFRLSLAPTICPWVSEDQWRRCFPDWNPTVTWVIIRCKPCSGYAQRFTMICMLDGAWDWARDYILLGLLCRQEMFVVRWFYWSAQTIRVVSQIYREQNNRGDVSQSENTDVTITDKADWIILIL